METERRLVNLRDQKQSQKNKQRDPYVDGIAL